MKLILENDQQIQFAHVKKIVLNENDILYVQANTSISAADIEMITKFFSETLGLKNKIIVLPQELSLKVVESK